MMKDDSKHDDMLINNLTVDEMKNKRDKKKKVFEKCKQHKKINKDFKKFKKNSDKEFNNEINNEISDEFNVEKNEIILINKKTMKKRVMRTIKTSFKFKKDRTEVSVKFKSRLKSELKHDHKSVLNDEKKNLKKKTQFKKHQSNNFSCNSFIILRKYDTYYYAKFDSVNQNIKHLVMSRFKFFNQYDDFTLYMNSQLF
jgi:hypothetical protein